VPQVVISQPHCVGSSESSLWMRPIAWLIDKKLSRNFWLFFTAAFFFDCGFAVYFFLFNLYLLGLHFDERAIGLVTGALTIGSLAGTLPVGFLADKLGLRAMLLICFLAAPAVGTLRASIVWLPGQIVLAFFAGMAMCIWGVCFSPTVASLTTSENRASAFSLIFSVSIGTSALGGLICGYAGRWLGMSGVTIGATELKRLILLVSCGIALVGLIPVMFLRFKRHDTTLTSNFSVARTNWRRAVQGQAFLLRFLPSMAIWAAVLAAFTPFANVYLSQTLKFPLTQVGLIFAASQVCQFFLGLMTPWLFRRAGLLRGIVLTQVATAAALLCLAMTSNMILVVILFLSFSAIQWMSSPGLYNLLMSQVREQQRSSASAMTMFSNSLLQSMAAVVAGIFFVRFGYPKVLSGIAGLGVLAALLFYFLVAPTVKDGAAVVDREDGNS
jgi:MFS family permease